MVVGLRHNGEEEQIHEFPTRSPSNLDRRSPQWASPPTTTEICRPQSTLSSLSWAPLPPVMPLRRYAHTSWSQTPPCVGPLMDHITVRLRSAHRSSNSRMARTEESAPCFPAADAFPRSRCAGVRVSSPHTSPGSPTDRA